MTTARSWPTVFVPPVRNQGVAMAISTTAFGVYFYLMSKIHNPTSLSDLALDVQSKAGEEPHAELAWLALASMAVFITGEKHRDVTSLTQLLKRNLDPIFRMKRAVLYCTWINVLTLHHWWFSSTYGLVYYCFNNCCCVQVLLSAGVRPRGWSCRRFSPPKWGGSPAPSASSPTGAWRSSSPKPSKTWWWVLNGIPSGDIWFVFYGRPDSTWVKIDGFIVI